LQMLGYTHEPLVLDGDPERTEAHLPMIVSVRPTAPSTCLSRMRSCAR
jgi:hypothetical protein